MSRDDYPVHEMPFMSSFTGSDWSHPEHRRTTPPQLTILLSSPDSPGLLFNDAPALNSTLIESRLSTANDFQVAFRAAQRSASVVYDSLTPRT